MTDRPAPLALPVKCQVCRDAPFSGVLIGWPGFAHEQPAAIRGLRIAVCAARDCRHRAVARAIIKAGALWPWHRSGHTAEERAEVERILAELRGHPLPADPPATPPPRASPPPPANPSQPSLF